MLISCIQYLYWNRLFPPSTSQTGCEKDWLQLVVHFCLRHCNHNQTDCAAPRTGNHGLVQLPVFSFGCNWTLEHYVQWYLIAVITGAAPPHVILTMCSLLDFQYLTQAPELNNNNFTTLTTSLQAFHDNKAAIITVRGWKGKRGVIDNWYIPKLELLQSVVLSIQTSGAPAQWTADVTEHAHIVVIKNPACRSNNVDIDPQICRQLDHLKKCSRFGLPARGPGPPPRCRWQGLYDGQLRWWHAALPIGGKTWAAQMFPS